MEVIFFAACGCCICARGERGRRGKKSSRAVVGDIANLCNLPATRSLYLNARMAVVGLCTVVRECIASRALPPAGGCSACQAHAAQFPQEMSERAQCPLSQSTAVGPHSLRSHIMALKSILAISFAVRSLPDSLRACTASKSGIVFSAAEADPAQHSFVPLRRPQGHFAETTYFCSNSGEWRRRLEEIH